MTDKTTMKQVEETIRENRLNREVHHFFERWTPEDPREAAEFQMAFHSVTRAIYADMQRPVNAALESCLRVANVQPIFTSKRDTP